MGGWDGGAIIGTVEEYDPTTDTWATKTSMNIARSYLGVAAANGKIYVMGGSNVNTESVNEEFDPAANSWTSKASMLTPKSQFGLAPYNGKILAMGGQISFGNMKANDEYDPKTDSWSTRKAQLPSERSNLCAVAVGGKVYAIGNNDSFKVGVEFSSKLFYLHRKD